MLFSGHENAISLAREYYIDYRCEFDLTFYPFDTQVFEYLKLKEKIGLKELILIYNSSCVK